MAYQWFLNPDQLAACMYTIASANLALNNGQTYTCVVSNSMGSITSAPITLAVLRDTVPPSVIAPEELLEAQVLVYLRGLGVPNSKSGSAA